MTTQSDWGDFYRERNEDFYETQAQSSNPLRKWFHSSRQLLVGEYVKKYYQEGKHIIDIGCGESLWNTQKIPLIGFDLNIKMLKRGKVLRTLKHGVVGDFTRIPFKNNSVDVILMTEVLEHIIDYKKTIQDVHQALKPGGIFITTVPYDTALSLWKPFFSVQCFIQGRLKGDEYYKKKCGHVNHFSPASIRKELMAGGFRVIQQFHNRFFTIFTIVQKV